MYICFWPVRSINWHQPRSSWVRALSWSIWLCEKRVTGVVDVLSWIYSSQSRYKTWSVVFAAAFSFLRWISTARYFTEKMAAVWTIASKYRYYSVTNPQKGVFPFLLWLLVQKINKKTSYPFSVLFFLYICKVPKFGGSCWPVLLVQCEE